MKIERTRIDFFSDVFLPSPSSDLKVPIHSREEGKKVTALLRRWSPRGLGTPEVKIASVPVPAFTGRTTWSSVVKRVLLAQPSSAASERVFSILSASFNDQQESALSEYLQASVMLQYNKR